MPFGSELIHSLSIQAADSSQDGVKLKLQIFFSSVPQGISLFQNEHFDIFKQFAKNLPLSAYFPPFVPVGF